MHKVFISYHHDNDQWYKNELIRIGKQNTTFIDRSVDTGDISESLSDEAIRRKIRDEYLRDSTVTIVLVGTETKHRKHIDWEIYSSMYDGPVNKKSAVLAICLPSTKCGLVHAPHGDREKGLFPDITNWGPINSREEYEDRYPYMPARIIDNLVGSRGKISVVPWTRVDDDAAMLEALIDVAFQGRRQCEYDLSAPMRRRNS
ncbi:TIR domain-containing protein [Candidatus Palauibacter irciniicola]|uniref:TIR domain-containing protein n=1 Tax=Candidatus Palauibacter irciniicola TaxID=3056733 RepID=UPI003B012F72